jgi:glutamate dehydrogenase
MGLTGYAQVTDLEQAMLDVWALSEGSSPDRIAAGTAGTTVTMTA